MDFGLEVLTAQILYTSHLLNGLQGILRRHALLNGLSAYLLCLGGLCLRVVDRVNHEEANARHTLHGSRQLTRLLGRGNRTYDAGLETGTGNVLRAVANLLEGRGLNSQLSCNLLERSTLDLLAYISILLISHELLTDHRGNLANIGVLLLVDLRQRSNHIVITHREDLRYIAHLSTKGPASNLARLVETTYMRSP